MRHQGRTKRSQNGVAIIEFTFSLFVLIPLLLGCLIFGFRLIRAIQMQQITRDIGHMYFRGIDFSTPVPIQTAQTLAQSFNLTVTGTSEMILSKTQLETQAGCDAANPASPPGTPCTNLNKPVFIQQLTIGHAGIGSSAFGTPPLQADLSVSAADQANNAAAQAVGFPAVLTLKAGEIAYVAEMVNQTPELNIPGFSGTPQVYSRSIF